MYDLFLLNLKEIHSGFFESTKVLFMDSNYQFLGFQ